MIFNSGSARAKTTGSLAAALAGWLSLTDYLGRSAALEGRVLFVSSAPGQPSSGFLKLNEALGEEEHRIGAERLTARCNPVNAASGCRSEWLEPARQTP